MNKTVLCVLLISLAFLCFVVSPVKAERKRSTLEEVKACAQESAALPSLLEEFNKAKKRTISLKKEAERIYDEVESKKNKLDKMDVKSQEELDRYNKLAAMINEQIKWERKAAEKFNNAVTKLKILKAKIEKKSAKYDGNCTNMNIRSKYKWIVCGKNGKYKDSDFCKKM